MWFQFHNISLPLKNKHDKDMIRRTVLFLSAVLLSTVLFSQDLCLCGEHLICKVSSDKSIYGEGILEIGDKSELSMPYIIDETNYGSVIIVDVVYDNKWNYPIDCLFNFSDRKTKHLSNRKKRELQCKVVCAVEELYRVLSGEKSYFGE